MTLRYWNDQGSGHGVNSYYSGSLGYGSPTSHVLPGTYANGTFTAGASHYQMYNGTYDQYYVEIDGANAVTDLVVGRSYSGHLLWGGGNPASIGTSNVTFTVLGFSTAGVVVQSNALGYSNGGWGYKTFLLGPTDASIGQTISGFDATSGDVVCFTAGTLIATRDGSVAVERLQQGDEVMTADGTLAPVLWLGHCRAVLSRRPDIAPIRIRAGALAAGVPSRDLLVSPEHCLGLDNRLVPARLLVNGSTILRDASMAEITYYHVELAQHALLLAEGAAAESWLDTGNRGMFANAPDAVDLHADFEGDRNAEAWTSRSCAPLLEGGPALATIRARLEGRAVAMGAGTTAPTLWLETVGTTATTLPAGHGLLRLASIAARVGGDHRRLGVGISAVRVADEPLALMDDRLALGFHGLEPCGALRWTDGQALLDLGACAHERTVAIDINVVAAEQSLAIAA